MKQQYQFDAVDFLPQLLQVARGGGERGVAEVDGQRLDAHVVDVVRLVEHHHALLLQLP